MNLQEVAQIRLDTVEALARPKPTTPGSRHVRALIDPLREQIVQLCDALLEAAEDRDRSRDGAALLGSKPPEDVIPNSDSYSRLLPGERRKADVIVCELLTKVGAYRGGISDARTDAVGIVWALQRADQW